MKLRDRMIYAGVVMSDLKRRHPAHVREFYRDILHVCDDHGRFEANVRDLRAVLFAPILDRVSERDVQGYLQALHVAGDIKLYTVRGRGFGKVTKWRQLRLRKKVADYPDEDGNIEELPLGDDGPLVSSEKSGFAPKKEGRKEGSVGRAKRADTHDELTLARIPEVQARWPHHDVAAAYRAAQRYVRNKRGANAVVTVDFFEREWMPNEPKKRMEEVAADLPEPRRWREWFKAHYEKEPPTPWAALNPEARAYYARQMGPAWLDSPCQGMGGTSSTRGEAA